MLVYQRVNDMFPKSQPNCVSLPVVPFESPRLPHSSPTGRRSAAEWHQIHVSDQPNAESNGDDLIGRRPGDIVWTAKRSTSYLKDPKILERSDAKNGYIKYLHIYIYIVYYIYIYCLYIYVLYIYIVYIYIVYIYNHPQNSILGWLDVNMSRYSWRHPQATCVSWLLVPVKASTPVPAEKASGEIPFAMKKCETNG